MGARPLTLDPTRTEVLRIYTVQLDKPELTDDDGQPVTYDVDVALRYDQAKAEQLNPTGYLAREEAARRACRIERRDFGDTHMVFADPDNVRLKRQSIVPARASR